MRRKHRTKSLVFKQLYKNFLFGKIVKLKHLYICVEKYIYFTDKVNFISIYLYNNLKFKTTFLVRLIIIIFRKIHNRTELIKLYVLIFIGKQFIFKIFLPLKSLFEYYKISFGLSRTHIKSISPEAFSFSGKPYLKTSFKENLIFNTFGPLDSLFTFTRHLAAMQDLLQYLTVKLFLP